MLSRFLLYEKTSLKGWLDSLFELEELDKTR